MKKFYSRWLAAACLATLGLVGSGLALRAQEAESTPNAEPSKPIAVIAFSGYDALMKDIDFVGSLVNQPQFSQGIEQLLLMMTQNKGLSGLDKSKPIGVIVQHDGLQFGGALCLPVSDLNALLDVAKGFGISSTTGANGVTEIKAQGQNIFAKSVGGWAQLSLSSEMLSGLPADPSALFAPLVGEYDIAARGFMQNVPEAYRENWLDLVSQSAREGLKKGENETDEQFAVRTKQVDEQLEQLKRLFKEFDAATVGLAIDSDQQRAFLDLVYVAIPGSQLATEWAEAGNAKTNLAGFYQPNEAVTTTITAKIDPNSKAQMEQAVQALREQANEFIDKSDKLTSDESKAQARSAADDLIQALAATVEGGLLDAGGVLNLSNDRLAYVGALKIGDPAKVEEALKKLADVAKKEHGEKFPGVKWDAQKYGDIRFHVLSTPVKDDDKTARQVLGDNLEFAVGIGKDVVYVAMGKDWLSAVKKVVDASAANPGKETPPMELTVTLAPILKLISASTDIPEQQRAKIASISEMLAKETTARDHAHLVVQPIENGIRTRFEVEEGVLRAIGMAYMPEPMGLPAEAPANGAK